MHIEPGVLAIIGSGGKSTLLRALAQELSAQGSVIVSTSTKMHVPDWCPVVLTPAPGKRTIGAAEAKVAVCEFADDQAIQPRAALGEIAQALRENSVVCVGSIHEPTGKLQASNLEFSQLASLADFVLVEADGAKTLPLKAHDAHEPVIPACAKRTVCVVGIDGVGKPIAQVCHRPERFARLAGVPGPVPASTDVCVTPEMVANVLNAEHFHDIVFVNKVESEEDWQAARVLTAQLAAPVLAGSLKRKEFQCLR